MTTSGYINNQPLAWLGKKVSPNLRLVTNDTPGRYGCSLDNFKEGGLDITLDCLAYSLAERDAIVAAFMKLGRSRLGLGGVDTGWYFSGKCFDRSTDLATSEYIPEESYPLSFGFATDEPFLVSEKVRSRGSIVTPSNQKWTSDTNYAGNLVDNYCFENWSAKVVEPVADTAFSTSSATTMGVLFSEDRLTLYVANFSSNTVSVINVANNAIAATVNVGTSPVGLALAKGKAELYVANSGASTVTVINTSTNTVITTITVGNSPRNLASSPAGDYMYVVSYSDSLMKVIRVSDHTVVNSISTGTNPEVVDCSPSGKWVAVGHTGENTVKLFDTTNSFAVTTVNVGGAVTAMVFKPDENSLYICAESNKIKGIDLSTFTVTKSVTLATGTVLTGMAMSQDGSRVFAVNQTTPRLTVINMSSAQIVTSTTLAYTPERVAVNYRGDKIYVTSTNTNVYPYSVNPVEPDNWIVGGNASGISHTIEDGLFSLLISPNNTNSKIGELFQSIFFEANTEYLIGCYYKIKNRTTGSVYFEIKENWEAVHTEVCSDSSSNFTWRFFTHTFDHIPKNATINAYVMNPGATEKIYLTHMVIMKKEDYDVYALGNSITTSGTVATEPDIEISGYPVGTNAIATATPTTWDYNNETSHPELSTASVNTWALLYTLTIAATPGIAFLITGLSYKLHTQYLGYRAYGIVTIQNEGIYGGVETPIVPFFVRFANYSTVTTNSLKLQSKVNTPIYIKFYGCTNYAGSICYMKDMTVNFLGGFTGNIYGSNVFPINLKAFNTDDPSTKMDLANVLYPGSTVRINSDGSGIFKYSDDFSTNVYSLIISGVGNHAGVSWVSGTLAVAYGNSVTYPFDIKYPIVGIPYLVLLVADGTPQISIQNYSGNNPDTAYVIDLHPVFSDGDLVVYELHNEANCQLAGSTRFDLIIKSNESGVALKLESIFVYADLCTIDARHPVISPGKNNEFEVEMDNDGVSMVSLIYRDKKWGI